MPIYEYACTACGERTEARQSFDDPPLQECSNCGGGLRKLYSPVGVVFKGSGFYSTDTRKSGDKSSKSTSSSESTSSKGDSPTKKAESSGSSTPSGKEKSA